MLAKFNSVNGKVLENLVLTGTKVLPFSQDILQVSYRTAYEMYDEIAAQESDFHDIYQQWQVFREQIYLWNQVNEISFANFAMR